MSELVTGMTFGGYAWTPSFVKELNHSHCIGCGRCYKVCPRDVDIDEFEDLDEDNAMVMTIHNANDCIGCEACSKVCPKDCFTHATLPAAA